MHLARPPRWRQFVMLLGLVALLLAACNDSHTSPITSSMTNIGGANPPTCPPTATCTGVAALNFHGSNHPAPNGNITVGDTQSPDTVSPIFADQRIDFSLISALYGSCVVAGQDLKWRPDECSQVPTIQNHDVSADGATITMKLLPDLKWSDGQPLTAQDFVFGWTILSDPQTHAFNLGGYSAIDRVSAADAHTVTVHFKTALGPYLTYLPYALPQHEFASLDHTAWSASAEVNFAPKATSGPYAIGGYQLNGHWDLLPNPFYTSATFYGPFLQKVRFQTFPDSATLARSVADGNVTLAQGFTPADLPALTATLGHAPTLTGSVGYEQVAYNQGNPLLAQVAVRQALSLAIDKCAIIQAVLRQPCNQAIATTITTPNALDYDKTVNPAHDLAQANTLLDQAGYAKKNSSGIRLGNDGKPLHFTLVTGTDAARAAESANLVTNWQALGVAVTVTTYANDALYANFAQQGILATGQWDIALYALLGSADPDFTYDIFHSSAIPSQANPGGVNYAHVSDPSLDAALQIERETLNFDDRVAALHQAQERIVAQQFDVAPLYIWPVITVSGAHLHGVLVGPALDQTDWNIADWWLAA